MLGASLLGKSSAVSRGEASALLVVGSRGLGEDGLEPFFGGRVERWFFRA
jgi:hypothetical protein